MTTPAGSSTQFTVQFTGVNLSPEQHDAIEKAIQHAVLQELARLNLKEKVRSDVGGEALETQSLRTAGMVLQGDLAPE